MTAYNSERYLAEAVASVFSQETSLSWELLFVDDGSSDHTLAAARSLAAQHPRQMRIFQHAGGLNLGISASRNVALRHARGEFLAFLDSDDVWLPHHLQTQVEILQGHPQLAMVFAAAERWFQFDQAFCEATARAAKWGENCLPAIVPLGKSAGLLPRAELLSWFRTNEMLVPCICTVVLRTAVARAVGGFCEEFRGLYDDQAFHAKVLLQHDVFANDLCTARYRQHPESCCHRARRAAEVMDTEKNRFQSFLERYTSGLEASPS